MSRCFRLKVACSSLGPPAHHDGDHHGEVTFWFGDLFGCFFLLGTTWRSSPFSCHRGSRCRHSAETLTLLHLAAKVSVSARWSAVPCWDQTYIYIYINLHMTFDRGKGTLLIFAASSCMPGYAGTLPPRCNDLVVLDPLCRAD